MSLHSLPALWSSDEKKVAVLIEARTWKGGMQLFRELFVETNALYRETNVEFIGKLMSKPSGSTSTRARCYCIAFEDDNIFDPVQCQLIGKACPYDAPTDNDDICCCHGWRYLSLLSGNTTAIVKPSM